MATAKYAIEVPNDHKIVDEKGNITLPWLQFFDIVAKATAKLRDGAESMETLTSASTATEMIDAWEELREILQEIT